MLPSAWRGWPVLLDLLKFYVNDNQLLTNSRLTIPPGFWLLGKANYTRIMQSMIRHLDRRKLPQYRVCTRS